MKILPDSMPGLRLSVAMIVRNEQYVLADTLQSVHAIADQVVVLDTGSTDQTLSVARQSGATVGQWPWSDDFAAARNECLKSANGDWVLWLDAGERLDADSAAELREFIDRWPIGSMSTRSWSRSRPSLPAAVGRADHAAAVDARKGQSAF